VGQLGKDGQVGAIGLRRRPRLADGEGAVGLAGDHQHRQPGDRGRVGPVEDHHVEVGEIGLVLQAVVVRPHLALRHGLREEHLPGQLGSLDDRPEAQRQVGLEELQRVAAGEAEARHQDPGRRHRREQDRARRGVPLEVLLDHQSTHRVADYDRRRPHRPGGRGDVVDVVRDPGPAESLGWRRPMTAEVESLDRPASVGEVAEEVLLPAPGAVPGTVHEKQRRPLLRPPVVPTHLPDQILRP
jgi:hypothetical protein